MTYKIDTCHSLAWCLPLIGQSKGLVSLVSGELTEWDLVMVLAA